MNRLFNHVVLLTLAAATAAVAQDVTYNYDQSADFSKFKTYRWVELQDADRPNQLLDQQIRKSIEGQLAQKGLTKATGDSADLFVGYQVSITQEKQVNAYNTGGAGWGYGARWGGGMSTATTSTVQIGTLVFDVYDPSAKQLVWRGQGTKTLDPSKDPAKNQQKLDKAVAKILKNFPPKKK